MKELSLVMATGPSDYGNSIYRDVETAVPTPVQERTAMSLYTLHEALKNIEYEIVVVEWLGTKGLRPLYWKCMKHPRIRIISVPYEFTKQVCPEKGFHETHAKNIGIRRACGKMIMGINNDCLWLDEFPRECLQFNGVMIADRPTVLHTVLNVEKDTEKLKKFCNNPENVVIEHDYNANGDFTLMPKDLWYQLQGLSTPRGDMIAGQDMWTIQRAQMLGKTKYMYPFKIYHCQHPGRPQGSSFGVTITSDSWGFPNEQFEEIK